MGNKLGFKSGKEINQKKFKEIFKKFAKKNKIDHQNALKFLRMVAEEAKIEFIEKDALEILNKIDEDNEGLDYEKFKRFFYESSEMAINKGDIKLSMSMSSCK